MADRVFLTAVLFLIGKAQIDLTTDKWCLYLYTWVQMDFMKNAFL